MIIAVASGKGGTGKTLVATNLALSLAGDGTPVQLIDCDVEEPNAHIFLKPVFDRTEELMVSAPQVDKDKCTYCRRCAEICAFKAITVFLRTALVFPELCHGCGACNYFCPEGAIREVGRPVGVLESGFADKVKFAHAHLFVGEPMAVPLIEKLKREVTTETTVILDAPPGTSCPVVSTVNGSDFCLLVTEPTPFGLNDLALAVEMVRQLHVPCGIVLNRAGLDKAGDEMIARFCHEQSLPLLLTIPLDRQIASFYSRGISLVEAKPEWRQKFLSLFEQLEAFWQNKV